MKPFNLEEAKAGKPVCTRDGRKVKIISFENPNSAYPILAKVFFGKDDYNNFVSTQKGHFFDNNRKHKADLMMVEGETEIEIPSLWTQSCTKENVKVNYIIKN